MIAEAEEVMERLASKDSAKPHHPAVPPPSRAPPSRALRPSTAPATPSGRSNRVPTPLRPQPPPPPEPAATIPLPSEEEWEELEKLCGLASSGFQAWRSQSSSKRSGTSLGSPEQPWCSHEPAAWRPMSAPAGTSARVAPLWKDEVPRARPQSSPAARGRSAYEEFPVFCPQPPKSRPKETVIIRPPEEAPTFARTRSYMGGRFMRSELIVDAQAAVRKGEEAAAAERRLLAALRATAQEQDAMQRKRHLKDLQRHVHPDKWPSVQQELATHLFQVLESHRERVLAGELP